MKFVLIALFVALTFAHQEYVHIQDWRNSSHNISEFIQGFAYGAFEEEIDDIGGCAKDADDLVETLIRDISPIIEGGAAAKALAITDLIWHMTMDIPNIISECGHIGNTTRDIIHITEQIFNEIINFKKFAHDLFVEFGPISKFITSGAIAIETGDWYKGGLNFGKVFKIIAHHASDDVKKYTQ